MNGKIFGGRYVIEEKIGSGGMAEVYRAHDETLNRTVAVKMLYPHFANEEDFVARFRREAQAAANLNHPNVVNIYDWGSEDSTYYIVMEFLVGKTLKELIQEKAPLDEKTIIDVGRQVAAAVGAAHRHDLVHRDIKPHNIIITESGDVKVTDFGIARSTASTMTQTGSILGTAYYLSPEQAQGKEVSGVSDLYSIGVVLFEMATGKVPFEGESPVSIALKHVHEAPAAPRRLNPDLSLNMQTVILKALSKNPNDRYQSAEELSADLNRCAEGLPISPVSTGGESTIIIPHTSPAATMVSEKKDEKPKKRSLALIITAIALALIAAAAIGGYFYYLNAVTVKTPKIVDLTEKEAEKILDDAGLRLAVSDQVFDPRVPKGKFIKQNPEAGEDIRKGSVVRGVLSKGKEKVKVPKLTGISLDQATFFLAKADLNVGDISEEFSDQLEADIVISQDPPAGDRVLKGTSVNLMVSKGPRPIRVPDVIGRTAAEAEAAIGQAQLSVNRSDEFSESVEEGRVIRQSPQPGTIIEKGGTVSIIVSKGPEMVTIPDVGGKDQDDAKSELEGKGFVVQIKTGISDAEDFGKVVSQSPAAGSQARKASTVTIWIGQPPPP